jgi:branched-subunit amino acid ABC-type transport system permease component
MGASLSIFVAAVSFGLVTAAILSLAALGFTLQAGMTNVVNLAYGSTMTVGAFAALAGETTFHLPLWPAVVFGAIAAGLLSVLINRAIIGPFVRRGTQSFQMLVVTFAIGIILEYAVVAKWGEVFYSYKGVSVSSKSGFRWGSFQLTSVQVVILVIAVVLLLGFHSLVRYTRFGRSLRGMADDKELARACGVNVAILTDSVWFMSGALAGLSGAALAINAGSFDEILGANFLLVVVAAAILGGAGEPYGAMIGAVIVGMAMEIGTVWIPGSDKEVVALGLLVVMVLVRPQGIVSGRGKWVLAA